MIERHELLSLAPIERAIYLALIAHRGQVDKAGDPYILHPLRIMLGADGEAQRIASVLHDAVEDSDLTLEELASLGFAPEIVEAVDALTKRPGESRIDAARRAAANPIARAVKLLDNADNSDISRIASPSPKDFARLEEYKQVRAILLAADSV